ncbi:hypothetical protein Ancab_029075, partial [Ancistrocladus abbreviatus]
WGHWDQWYFARDGGDARDADFGGLGRKSNNRDGEGGVFEDDVQESKNETVEKKHTHPLSLPAGVAKFVWLPKGTRETAIYSKG